MACTGKSKHCLYGQRFFLYLLFALLCVVLPASNSVRADQKADNEKAAREAMYRDLQKSVDPANLERTVETLSKMQSRIAGYPDDAKAAQFVEQQFNSLGLSNVSHDDFDVTVPYDRGVDDPAQAARIMVLPDDHHLRFTERGNVRSANSRDNPVQTSLRMYPLWPNLVRTPTLPTAGLTGPLIYVRDGKLRNFNGKIVDGAIVMVDFNCAAEWMNAPRLGARAVIFVAPRTSMRGEAEAKFISIPIAIPRFYMKEEDAAPLLALCESGRPPQVTLTCDMPWQTHTARNITGYIEGTDREIRDQVIVNQAYYDSTSVVPALAPGAETSCGIAAMLEQIRIFKAHPPKRSMMFVATSAHFQALQGIREYVEKHIDAWTPPSVVESSLAKQHANQTAIWLGLFLVVTAVMTARALVRKPGQTAKRLVERNQYLASGAVCCDTA